MTLNSLITAASFTPDLLQAPSAWLGHLPFAAWVIQEASPKIFVELGTHWGHSYFSFCQSVVEAGISVKCYAVDTWHGDEHAGQYNDEVFDKVNAHHQEHYAGFSRLLRMTFDEAVIYFANESIELLHIDGLHTYEAVRHDFETWLPKLAPGAVIMFHDINVREREFGVWKLWEELQMSYPNNLEFVHSHGLGVLQLNNAVDDKKLEWLQTGSAEKQRLTKYFAALGSRQLERFDLNQLKQHACSLDQAVVDRDGQIADLNQAVAERDGQIAILNQAVAERDGQIAILNQALAERDGEIASLNKALAERVGQITSLNQAVAERNGQIASLNQSAVERDSVIQHILASTSWRITQPLRAVKSFFTCNSGSMNVQETALPGNFLVHNINRARLLLSVLPLTLKHSGNVRRTMSKAWSVFTHEGWVGVWRRVLFLHSHVMLPRTQSLVFNRDDCAKHVQLGEVLTEETCTTMREIISTFSHQPLISVVMPTYNPHPEWLNEAIESVRKQVYPHWELCIADDASSDKAIRPILERYAREDMRIKVVFREQNGNISAASNSALIIATGEYVALLDHDDELAPDALFWVAKEIDTHPAADVIYSDEDKISPSGSRTDIFFKPDWSPELMFNCMYMGHLTIYKKALINQVGGFRSGYDFSQDYDLALRATEVAQAIRHIPRILYHWRQADGSAAQGGKPYARVSNLAALQAAVDRRGITARVIELPTANRVKIIGWQPNISIVIPTDSEVNLTACLDAIAEKTDYPSWEIIVVTNSKLADLLTQRYDCLPLTFCRYDKPYNFSDKCNEGARQASGEIVVFFNDDVRPLSNVWLDNLVELLALPEVGAVAPKLLYENQRIQHAGLVSGVRGLVGTAFHCRPENTSEHFNFAQSVRDVSAVSGACFAMRRCDFLDVGGFDAVNTPIMHSDVDLSFKVREKGLRCVYTPHATLLHIGHQSLRKFDKKLTKISQDKADIFLLKRWGSYITYDPYFTDNMRGLLYHDSLEPIGMWGQNRPELVDNHPDVLLVTHDMSGSGAPMVVYLAAKHLLKSGAFPVVASPEDGPMRALFTVLGIPVIIDPLLLTRHESVKKLASNFDCVLANTIASWPIVCQVLEETLVPVMWYLHECHLIPELANKNHLVSETLRKAKHVYAGSERSASFSQPYNQFVKILTYGVPDIYCGENVSLASIEPMIFSVFGTIEPRKGQDIFLEAISFLGNRAGGKAIFNLVGRTLDEGWLIELRKMAEGLSNVFFHGEVEHHQYLKLMSKSHVIVCPSRDDTLPLVTLDALCLGKTLISTDTTGTSNFMTNGKDGFVVPSSNPEALAEAILRLIEDPARLASIGIESRQTFLRHFVEDKFAERLVDEVRSLSRRIS